MNREFPSSRVISCHITIAEVNYDRSMMTNIAAEAIMIILINIYRSCI